MDRYPVSEGHALFVSEKLPASPFNFGVWRSELWSAAGAVRSIRSDGDSPNFFNIGINEGPAGQTVMHSHIDVIPRGIGDRPDLRHPIFPDKAICWDQVA